jgi:hypothetical protein
MLPSPLLEFTVNRLQRLADMLCCRLHGEDGDIINVFNGFRVLILTCFDKIGVVK